MSHCYIRLNEAFHFGEFFLFIFGENMKVSKDKVVSMHYTLKNDAGEVIDSSDG